jgi:hypothetical protein
VQIGIVLVPGFTEVGGVQRATQRTVAEQIHADDADPRCSGVAPLCRRL